MSTATGVREFLQITQESAYLTPVGSPSLGTSQLVIALQDGNSFTMRPNPVVVDIPYGGGLAVRKSSVSDKTELKGHLKTRLCYTQAAFLLGAAFTRINAAQTSPWTTTEPIGDLASFTVDHAIYQDDTGTYKRRRYLGCKVSGAGLDVSEDSETMMLDIDLVASTPQGNTFDSSSDPSAETFPVPADSAYATDYVLFTHSGGNLTLNDATFLPYYSLKLATKNVQDMKYYANRFVQIVRTYGREITLDSDIVLLASPDFRGTYFELVAALAETSVVFNNGSHSITLDLKTNSRIKGLDDDLPLEKLYGRKLQLVSGYDVSNTTDFNFAFS